MQAFWAALRGWLAACRAAFNAVAAVAGLLLGWEDPTLRVQVRAIKFCKDPGQRVAWGSGCLEQLAAGVGGPHAPSGGGAN